jgi:hypothetical protein
MSQLLVVVPHIVAMPQASVVLPPHSSRIVGQKNVAVIAVVPRHAQCLAGQSHSSMDTCAMHACRRRKKVKADRWITSHLATPRRVSMGLTGRGLRAIKNFTSRYAAGEHSSLACLCNGCGSSFAAVNPVVRWGSEPSSRSGLPAAESAVQRGSCCSLC